jgi:Flp pilus assembly protein TadD
VIRDNPTIRHLWPAWIPLSPPAGIAVSGRPLLNLSFALCYGLGGEAPWPYHAFNLSVHILAALVLFGVLRRTLALIPARAREGADGETGPGRATGLAFAIALLWTVHPLQTATVTYISQRSEGMMGLFYLLTLYCFIRYADPAPQSSATRQVEGGLRARPLGSRALSLGNPLVWAALSVGACLLGMATKQTMVTAPVLVFLYDRTFVSLSFREAWKRHRGLHLALASTWALLAPALTGLRDLGIGSDLGLSRWTYGFLECKVVLQYLWLSVWPHPLCLDYGPPVNVHAGDFIPWLCLLLPLLAAVGVALVRHPALGFAGAWFVLILAPTSSLIPVSLQPMAENRAYLPLAAVLCVGVVGLDFLLGSLRRTLACVGAAALLCAALTIARNTDYATEAGIWRDTVAKQPGNTRARYNLGTVLLKEGCGPEAILQLGEAVRLSPFYPEAHANLGLALADAGRFTEALAEYRQALRLKPDAAGVHNNLGISLVRLGRTPEAIPEFEAALRLDPSHADACGNLATALFESGRIAEAAARFQEAVGLRPTSAGLRNRLGVALAETGRLPEAIAQFEEAARLSPRSVQSHVNLGSALANENRFEEAAVQFEEAVRIDPRSADTHLQLGMALRALGRTDDAQAQFEIASRLRDGAPQGSP